MPRPWKRPDLPPGPLCELNRALHELHHRAGWPSSRDIQRALDAKGVPMSHTKVHDTLIKSDLPTQGAVEMIAEVLAETVRGADVEVEVARMLQLWRNAALGDQSVGPVPASPENHTVTTSPPAQEKKDTGEQPSDRDDSNRSKCEKSRAKTPKNLASESKKKQPRDPGQEKTEAQAATLVIGNLGPTRLDVLVDSTFAGTVLAGETGRFPVEAGKRAVQVDSGGRRSALRRIAFKRGGTVRVAFDIGAGSDAVPEPVERVAFTGGRERKAILAGGAAAAPLLVTGMVLIPNSTEPVGEQLGVLVTVVLIFGVIGVLMGASWPARLNLSGRELEFGEGRQLQSIHWSELVRAVSGKTGGRSPDATGSPTLHSSLSVAIRLLCRRCSAPPRRADAGSFPVPPIRHEICP